MFDKITIRATVSEDECVHLSHIHRLRPLIDPDGVVVEYRSSEYSKLSGVEVRIVHHAAKNINVLTMKTSLHKFWEKRQYGRLRNDTLFTISEAKAAFSMLLFENGLTAWRVRIVQFELGLNMHVSYSPLKFIEQVRHICYSDKHLFVDANFRINRQRTTMKHKDIRKYFKIYDKGFEMEGKKRGTSPPTPLHKRGENRAEEYPSPHKGEKAEDSYILRIETVYKRHSERGSTFFSDANVERLVQRFYADWKGLFFYRDVRAYKGARKSEVERAKEIINRGASEYMDEVKRDFDNKQITPKQYRTIREFIQHYQKNNEKYQTVISLQEKEFKSLFYKTFTQTKK